MSNEVKIGILAVAALALSFWGYKFIMGKNLLVKSNVYKVVYNTTEGMQVGTPVRINGVEVGSVASVELMIEDPDRKVMVYLDLDRSIKIPKTTKAVIVAVGFMGGKAVNLMYDRPCKGSECAESGQFLEGETRGLLASMVGEDKAEAYMNILKRGLSDIVDTLNAKMLSEDANTPLGKSLKDLQLSLAHLESATSQVDGLMQRSSGKIDGTLTDLKAVTGTLNTQKDQISGIITNANTVSKQLAEADLKKTIGEVQSSIAGLKKTLANADQALTGVSDVVAKINKGEGSLGKMMNDEQLYKDIKKLSTNADSLVNDMQQRPYRYIPLKSRRKVKKYDKLDAAAAGGQ